MTKQKINIDPAKIHLKLIEEVYSKIEEIDEADQQSEFDTNLAHKSAYNISANGFLLGLKVEFKTSGKDKTKSCQFRYNFHFIIDNLEEMYHLNEDDLPVFQTLFVATLSGISYSTLRGIIFEKTLKTNWNGLTLPVVDPSLLLNSWIEKD
ncbi:hypothetical protein [Ulvibacterium marinum]|uniref:hypothetical protein n=1 Tax=Ulvibacterium marinum TaxID=2419782 RepID=UPI00249436C8|nr:hypothetical protein [Ulvibacterium marinum]